MRFKDSSPSPPTVPLDKAAASRLRLLDFDDLFLLTQLLQGQTIAATAKQLGLTQPAITQRVRKMERVFAETLLTKVGRNVRLTLEGQAICQRASEALALMLVLDEAPTTRGLTIAANADILRAWLGPALRALRVRGFDHVMHADTRSDDEWPSALQAARVDAVITMADARPSACDERVIAEVEYVIVSGLRTAPRIQSADDLSGVVLIERDRALSLWSQIEPSRRDKLQPADAWFLGSEAQILAAVAEDLGVAVLPASVAAPALAAGRVAIVLPEVELASQRLRMICRRDLADDPRLEELARVIASCVRA